MVELIRLDDSCDCLLVHNSHGISSHISHKEKNLQFLFAVNERWYYRDKADTY